MSQVDVPVVGGHAGLTILPLFSQATPLKDLGAEERDALTKRTQDGGTEVVQAKAGKVGLGAALALVQAAVLAAWMAGQGFWWRRPWWACGYGLLGRAGAGCLE